jgi:hypothetical protein
VQFLLSLVILSQVGILITELVEVLDELIEDCLLAISVVQVLKEVFLDD